MEHIGKGCVSDHSDVELYMDIKSDNAQLSKYRSTRGSSSQEGFHRHLRRCIAALSLNPALADYMMLDVISRWNYNQSIRLGIGKECFSNDLSCLKRLFSRRTANGQFHL